VKQGRQVAYIPKSAPGDPAPWITFGGTREDYEKWAPHICGICCLKMAGDTWGLTEHLSLLELSLLCLARGGFKEEPDGTIRGVFHHPLLDLARDLGMSGLVAGRLTPGDVAAATAAGSYVMLSVDLARLGTGLRGGHLILVHGHDAASKKFTLHDCAAAFHGRGKGVILDQEDLERLSNGKGLILRHDRAES